MLGPLTTPCKQPSTPSPLPFQLSNVNISNFESINFLTMRPLTIMPRLFIIQSKCTYVFTQIPHTSMNPKLVLATVVSSILMKTPNSQSNQIIFHQNSMHQFLPRATSLTLACPTFKNFDTGSSFINSKDAVPLYNALHEMGYIEDSTPIQFGNIVANSIITDTVLQRIYKAMDMRFYWIHYRCRQKQFHVHWKQGKHNLADYPSEHLSAKNHISVRPTYVLNTIQKQTKTLFKLSTTLQGCV